MGLFRKRSQSVIKTGLATLAASAATVTEAYSAVAPKAPGETKIVAFTGGDRGHNRIPLEYHIRGIFSTKRDWRLIFVLASDFFTPELISDADLLILSRHSRPDDIAWRSEGLADSMKTGAQLWTDENVGAIVDNVRNRGMGFLALHNTIACGNREIQDLLGVEPIGHKEIQPLWIHSLNQDHPVTRGLGKFVIALDEQFAAVIKSHYTTSLFETTAMHDKRHAVGGWCHESGKGRVACLLPGHLPWAYRTPEYREILWRAAHWAVKQDITPYPGAPRSD